MNPKTTFKVELTFNSDYKESLQKVLKVMEGLRQIDGLEVNREFEHVLPNYGNLTKEEIGL